MTHSPSKSPNGKPTIKPSVHPTIRPSVHPTSIPTALPTNQRPVCIEILLADSFGDGWSSAHLALFPSDGDDLSFSIPCGTGITLQEYCFDPLTQNTGDFVVLGVVGYKPAYPWEIFWQVLVKDTGRTYTGSYDTSMIFSFTVTVDEAGVSHGSVDMIEGRFLDSDEFKCVSCKDHTSEPPPIVSESLQIPYNYQRKSKPKPKPQPEPEPNKVKFSSTPDVPPPSADKKPAVPAATPPLSTPVVTPPVATSTAKTGRGHSSSKSHEKIEPQLAETLANSYSQNSRTVSTSTFAVNQKNSQLSEPDSFAVAASDNKQTYQSNQVEHSQSSVDNSELSMSFASGEDTSHTEQHTTAFAVHEDADTRAHAYDSQNAVETSNAETMRYGSGPIDLSSDTHSFRNEDPNHQITEGPDSNTEVKLLSPPTKSLDNKVLISSTTFGNPITPLDSIVPIGVRDAHRRLVTNLPPPEKTNLPPAKSASEKDGIITWELGLYEKSGGVWFSEDGFGTGFEISTGYGDKLVYTGTVCGTEEDGHCQLPFHEGVSYEWRVGGAMSDNAADIMWSYCSVAGYASSQLSFTVVNGHCVPDTYKELSAICRAKEMEKEYIKKLNSMRVKGSVEVAGGPHTKFTADEVNLFGKALGDEFEDAGFSNMMGEESMSVIDIKSDWSDGHANRVLRETDLFEEPIQRINFIIDIKSSLLGVGNEQDAADLRVYLGKTMASGLFAARVRSLARVTASNSLTEIRKVSLVEFDIVHKVVENRMMSAAASLVVTLCAVIGLVFGLLLTLYWVKTSGTNSSTFRYSKASKEESEVQFSSRIPGLIEDNSRRI